MRRGSWGFHCFPQNGGRACACLCACPALPCAPSPSAADAQHPRASPGERHGSGLGPQPTRHQQNRQLLGWAAPQQGAQASRQAHAPYLAAARGRPELRSGQRCMQKYTIVRAPYCKAGQRGASSLAPGAKRKAQSAQHARGARGPCPGLAGRQAAQRTRGPALPCLPSSRSVLAH